MHVCLSYDQRTGSHGRFMRLQRGDCIARIVHGATCRLGLPVGLGTRLDPLSHTWSLPHVVNNAAKLGEVVEGVGEARQYVS